MLLEAEASGFVDWLEAFLALRNDVKQGVNSGFSDADARGLSMTTYRLPARWRDDLATFDFEPLATFTMADALESARRVKQVLTLLASRR